MTFDLQQGQAGLTGTELLVQKEKNCLIQNFRKLFTITYYF